MSSSTAATYSSVRTPLPSPSATPSTGYFDSTPTTQRRQRPSFSQPQNSPSQNRSANSSIPAFPYSEFANSTMPAYAALMSTSHTQHTSTSSLLHPQQVVTNRGPADPERRGGVDDPTASSPFLRDVNLVAEAAKRAQMACLMRDMGEVAL
ncbi:hypothetical protein MMC09_006303 [Bachmanniomyces sp. S44760]|nr:hypothetical protein [Bachmanniomyces sp. S44760]